MEYNGSDFTENAERLKTENEKLAEANMTLEKQIEETPEVTGE
jgi:hypothetical protein